MTNLRIAAGLLLCVLKFQLCAGEPVAVPDAAGLIKQMRAFCGGLNALACEIDFLRIANSERKLLERRAHFEAAFQRPNLLSVVIKDDGNVTYSWISDGKEQFTFQAGAEKFVEKPAQESLEGLLASSEIYIVKDTLEYALLLDELVRKDLPAEELPLKATSASYVRLEDVDGEKAHRVRLSGPKVSWDVWIAASATPLPLKIYGDISAVANPPGPGTKTEVTVGFKNWLPDAKLDPKVFQFDPKSKARRASGFLPDIPPHPLLNKPAPAITLDCLDGTRVELASHKGREIVVLDFWSMSCVPCLGLLPKVDAVAKKYAGRGVVFYAMNENDKADEVRNYFAQRGYSMKVTLQNKAVNFGQFKVDELPQMFVLDKDGNIRAAHSVHAKDLVVELSEQIEALLAGREVPQRKAE